MKVKYHVIFYLSFSLTLGKVFYSEDARLFFKSGKLSSMNYFLPSIPSGFFFLFLFVWNVNEIDVGISGTINIFHHFSLH